MGETARALLTVLKRCHLIDHPPLIDDFAFWDAFYRGPPLPAYQSTLKIAASNALPKGKDVSLSRLFSAVDRALSQLSVLVPGENFQTSSARDVHELVQSIAKRILQIFALLPKLSEKTPPFVRTCSEGNAQRPKQVLLAVTNFCRHLSFLLNPLPQKTVNGAYVLPKPWCQQVLEKLFENRVQRIQSEGELHS